MYVTGVSKEYLISMEKLLIANGAEIIRIDGKGRLTRFLPKSEAHSLKCPYLSRIDSPRADTVTLFHTGLT